ncbi:AAA family ATPase [Mycolicibacterium komossense]|uniref:Dephospho-CoA kinase n=1 Tax=Mycolicibacterium komossense TaxID=1779 RepID=A0ABT3CGH3_9MYCO|nr:AAA family ATPase [Mycolicibacterium komossense]MCV7228585.1 dephospho-CoA kinase [Mycolicibacterium komossense]
MVGVGSAGTVLVILRGSSGSGKSTIARRLRDRYGLAVVSQDVLRREVPGVDDHRDNPAIEAEQDPDAIVDLIADAVRW